MSRRYFTLLELLLVLLILGLIAGSAALMVGGQMDQQVDAANRTRVAQLKTAICGDPNAGLPDASMGGVLPMSGFVNDMGRLPLNINELLVQGAQPSSALDVSSGTRYGWRGPYLSVIPDANGLTGAILPRFRDAWGTINTLGSDDANFGWFFPAVTPSGDLAIQSLGKDGLVGGVNYDADIPAGSPLIANANYSIDLNSFRVTTVTIFCVGSANTISYYNSPYALGASPPGTITGALRNRQVRLGFLTPQNINLPWLPANFSTVSDQTATVQNTALAVAGGSRTVTPVGGAFTFVGKRIPCGRRIPVLFLDVAVKAGALFKDQVVGGVSTLGTGPRTCISRTEYIFCPSVAAGSATFTFDLRIP